MFLVTNPIRLEIGRHLYGSDFYDGHSGVVTFPIADLPPRRKLIPHENYKMGVFLVKANTQTRRSAPSVSRKQPEYVRLCLRGDVSEVVMSDAFNDQPLMTLQAKNVGTRMDGTISTIQRRGNRLTVISSLVSEPEIVEFFGCPQTGFHLLRYSNTQKG